MDFQFGDFLMHFVDGSALLQFVAVCNLVFSDTVYLVF